MTDCTNSDEINDCIVDREREDCKSVFVSKKRSGEEETNRVGGCSRRCIEEVNELLCFDASGYILFRRQKTKEKNIEYN